MTLLRLIGGVALGYIAIFALGFAGAVALWSIFGAEGAFQEGTTVVSVQWNAINIILMGPVGAVGGWVARKVARSRGLAAVRILAGLALGLGLVIAIAGLGREVKPLPEGKTVGELSFFEAGEVATNTAWYAFSTPWIGALGILVGGRALSSSED